MRLFKFQNMVIFVTILALIYIHMQVQTFELAYEGKKKERQLDALIEENLSIQQDILALTSSNYLGDMMLAKGGNMQFRGSAHTLQLVTKNSFEEKIDLALKPVSSRMTNFFSSIFSLKSSAEAGPVKRD